MVRCLAHPGIIPVFLRTYGGPATVFTAGSTARLRPLQQPICPGRTPVLGKCRVSQACRVHHLSEGGTARRTAAGDGSVHGH
ncbi:hypothetical protein MBT84_20255 [Streptomyces sp. MBT84]|nr:hypothetical protein [Streptomyces sp. MBT84]